MPPAARVIKPRFQIHLHKKDLFVLEAIKNFLGVGKIYVQGTTSAEYRVLSIYNPIYNPQPKPLRCFAASQRSGLLLNQRFRRPRSFLAA